MHPDKPTRRKQSTDKKPTAIELLKAFRVTQAVLAAVAGLAAIATAIEPRWVEGLFEASPDGGSGAAEWWLTIGLALVSLACAALAFVTHLRIRHSQRDESRVLTSAREGRI